MVAGIIIITGFLFVVFVAVLRWAFNIYEITYLLHKILAELKRVKS